MVPAYDELSTLHVPLVLIDVIHCFLSIFRFCLGTVSSPDSIHLNVIFIYDDNVGDLDICQNQLRTKSIQKSGRPKSTAHKPIPNTKSVRHQFDGGILLLGRTFSVTANEEAVVTGPFKSRTLHSQELLDVNLQYIHVVEREGQSSAIDRGRLIGNDVE